MSVVKCLATLRRLRTLSTRTAIASVPRSGRRARAQAAAILPRSASVAASRLSRLRARSASRNGFLQATSRSPGKSGEVISARSWTSNSDSCRSPPRTSFLTCGARSAVIQSSPAGATSSRSRAAVSMPRSPASTTRVSPNRSLTLVTWAATVFGSPVLPLKTSMAIGHPKDGVRGRLQIVYGQQPAPHPVLGVADRAQRAGPALERGTGHVIQHQGAAGQVPGGQRVLDLLLPLLQVVHRRVQVILITRPQPEDLAQAQLAGRAEDGGDVAVRQAAGDLERPVQARGGRRLPLEHPGQGLDLGLGPGGQVGQGPVLDLPGLAVAFPQQDRGG